MMMMVKAIVMVMVMVMVMIVIMEFALFEYAILLLDISFFYRIFQKIFPCVRWEGVEILDGIDN